MKTKLAPEGSTFLACEPPCQPVIVLPDDLRSWVPEQNLVRSALEAVQLVPWPEPVSWQGSVSDRTFPRPLLMTVLVYSYAAGVFGSRDIEFLAHHDGGLRYLCRSGMPDWNTLRHFRRHHLLLLTPCLRTLFELVWNSNAPDDSRLTLGGTDCGMSSKNRWRITDSEPDFAGEAERRVIRAIQTDSMALDD